MAIVISGLGRHNTFLRHWIYLHVSCNSHNKQQLSAVVIFIYIYIYISQRQTIYIYIYIKVKLSLYRPGVAQRLPGFLRFPDYMTTAQDCGKVVGLTYRPPLPPGKCSWCSFLLETESTPGPRYDRKDFMSMKYSNDTSWDRTSDLLISSTAR